MSEKSKSVNSEKPINFSIESLLSEKTPQKDEICLFSSVNSLEKCLHRHCDSDSDNLEVKREIEEVVSTSGDFYQKNYQDGKI